MKNLKHTAILVAALACTGARAADAPIDAAVRKDTIARVLAMLDERYVAPENMPKIKAALSEHAAKGDYDKLTDAREFAKALTAHLYDASKDGHMYLTVLEKENAQPGGQMGQAVDQKNAPEAIRMRNYDFRKVEVFDGNVGYVKIDRFDNAELAGPTATAAMGFVANTDALIFDLRDCTGGGRLLHYLVTYMFRGEPRLLSSVAYRGQPEMQFWSLPYVPGQRYADNPVYVLTSKRTNSGCEAFSNILKNNERAVLVGETTRGAGNPNMHFRVNDRFELSVPIGRAADGRGFEGKGVTPHVAVPEQDALRTAQRLALDDLQKKAGDDRRRAELAKARAALQ